MENSNELLLDAAESGDSVTLLKALSVGAEVDAKTPGGWTASMRAANNGHVDCLSLLVEAGADMNAKNSEGWTASMRAANNGHLDGVQMIEAEIERRALLKEVAAPSPSKSKSTLRV
jgi:ankyrin repeat protein